MKALLFAAGLGTRLRPLTNDRPKALVSVLGKPLLAHALDYLEGQGVTEVVVNVHHFADLVEAFLKTQSHRNLRIHVSDEREQVLETGGALLKAAPLLAGTAPIVLYNVDVLTNLSLSALRTQHQAQQALATLAVRQRESSRYLLFDHNDRLSGWRHQGTGEERLVRVAPTLHPFAFSGVHLIDPALLDLIPQQGVFSIVETYLSLAGDHKLVAHRHDDDYWFDVGKPERLRQAHVYLEQKA